MATKLGIFAGGGGLPGRLIEACVNSARPYFVVALEGQADAAVIGEAPHEWCRLGAADKAFKILQRENVEEVVFAGKVERPSLTALRPDARAMRLFVKLGRKAMGDDGLLSGIVAEIEVLGFTVVGPETILDALAPESGPVGRHTSDDDAKRDIERAVEVLKALGDADVGQAAVVQDGLVLGVEAIEGTDAMIERCGALRREGPGGVLVKIRKPGQEDRVDLPTIGPDTVRRAAAAGLRGIAIEAGGGLIIDREALVREADDAGLFVETIAVE